MRARTAHLAAAAMLAAFGAFLGVFALRSYFFQDEFHYLRLAKEEGLTWDNLSGSVFGGFVPLFKLAFHPILGVLDVSYTAVALILVGLGVLAGWQLWRILVLVAGPTPESLAALCLVCFSAVWIPSAIWPADGLHTLPAIVLLLASVEAYLRYMLRDAGWRAIAVSVVAFGLALGFFSKLIVLPPLLLIARHLVLEPAPNVRAAWRAVLAEWRVWAAYAAVTLLFLGYVAAGDYSRDAPGGQPIDYVRAAKIVAATWFNGWWPGAFSIGGLDPRLGLPAFEPVLEPTPLWVVAAGQLVLLALVALTIHRRPQAWRAWAWFAVAWLADVLIFATGRDYFGTAVGREYRYYVDLLPLLGIALAFALRGPPVRDWDAIGRRRRFVAAVAAVLLAAHAAAAVVGAEGILEAFPEQESRSYVHNFRADASSMHSRTGRPVALIDGGVPGGVMTPLYGRFSQRSVFLPVLADHLSFNDANARPLHTVRGDGHIVPIALDPVATGRAPGCLSGPANARVAVAPAPVPSADRLIRLRTRAEEPLRIFFALVSATGEETDALGDQRDAPVKSGEQTTLASLKPGVDVAAVRIDLDPGERVCVERVELVAPREVAAR